MAIKKAFLVIPKLKQDYCISRAFETIADVLHGYTGQKKSYVYDELRFNKKGGMVITLVLDNNHENELKTILNDAMAKSEGNIESFKTFAFETLLSKDGYKVDMDKKESTIANAQKIAIRASKKAFLVIPMLKGDFHVCEAFDKIADALHEYADSDKSYVYDEMRIDGKGAMLISLKLKVNHKDELKKILENAKKNLGEHIEFFKIFAFSELLNKKTVKAEYLGQPTSS